METDKINIFNYLPDPFQESGALWVKTPYFVWAIANLVYAVFWMISCLLYFTGFTVGAIIGLPAYAIGKVLWTAAHILWISLSRKDGTAKTEMRAVWKKSGIHDTWDYIWQCFDFSECYSDLPISRRASWMD